MLPYTTLFSLDKDSAQSVYQQIAGQIVQHIRTGVLKPGSLLPGTRELASLLSLHRKTIVAAYNGLRIGFASLLPDEMKNAISILSHSI